MFLGLTPQEREERRILNRVMGVGGNLNAHFLRVDPKKSGGPQTTQTRYRVNDAGDIETLGGVRISKFGRGTGKAAYDAQVGNFPYTSLQDAINAASKKTRQSVASLEEKYKDELSRERTYTALADQIRALGGAGGMRSGDINQALAALSGERNYGTSDLANMLNFQVSDEQIINDYNTRKLGRLNQLVQEGNAQIVGITERVNAINTLLGQLPAGDPRRTSSEVTLNQLLGDLRSVQSGVNSASEQIKNFKPVEAGSEEGLKQIVSFREYISLPEERASQQLRQIDPEAYKTAVGLGQKYRRMATEPLPETTTPQTEQLRQTIEQEALNQLRLGSTLGAEERRGYEQAVRAAQTARGNIFGLGPAVQEAAEIGRLGEERKLARYGAAQQFLASGETTGAAAARDLALRDALTQQRLGAAAGFVAGGPSIANLAQARTQQQQQAFQNYVASSMAGPGQFAQAPSTAQPFFQVAEQQIPVSLTGTFANLYGSQAQYQSSVYGSQVGAIARQPSGAEQFGQIATGLSNLIKI